MINIRFWSRAAAEPDRIVLVTSDGVEHRAGDVLDLANQIVNRLRAGGADVGDVLATVLPNGLEVLAAYLAAMQAGWYLTPINHHLTESEIGYLVENSGARCVIAHERFAGTVTAALEPLASTPELVFVGEVDGYESVDQWLAATPATTPSDRTAGAVMYYTSGTTGRPKGVRRPLAESSPDDAAIPFLDMLGLFGITTTSDDVHLCTSPMYHTAVLAFAASALHTGQQVVLMDRFDATTTLELIERHHVTNSHMVPTQFHRLLALSDDVRAGFDVSSLRYVIHGAAPCPPDVKRRMIEWWGPVIYEYYGTTEGGGTFVDSTDWLGRPGTVGQAWEGADIRILDDDGEELPRGEIGAVYIYLGPEGFRYHNDDEKTDASRRGDYFTVGDIGYMDDDGYLFLKDRSSNLIIAGGVNIYPAEIENALLSHPEVADVAVFGIPDDDLGERVVAVVEARSALPDVDALRTHCERLLARFKVPREFSFVAELPRDPSGKLFKRKVRETYLADTSSPTGAAGRDNPGSSDHSRKEDQPC